MKLLYPIILLFFMYADVLAKKIFKFDRFQVCESPETSPFKWGTLNIRTINYRSYIDSEVDLLRDVNKVTAVLKITRCANKDSLDTCEYYGTFPFKETCLLYTQRNGFFYDFAASYTPNLKCPFKKGHYVQVNGTLDAELFSFFPTGSWYWKLKNELHDYHTGELYGTYCIEAGIINIRG